MMMSRLASAIVRRYPAPWRERYEAEVLALVDESSVRAIDVIELVRGLFVERVKGLIEPSDHPTLTEWAFWGIRFIPAPVVVLGGAALGEQLGRTFGEAPDAVWITALGVAAATLIVDIGSRTALAAKFGRVQRSVSAVSVVAAFVFIAAFHWFVYWSLSGPASTSLDHWGYWLRLFVWTTLTHQSLARHWPWRPMLDALQRFQAASHAVRHAQDDVARCMASTEDVASWHLILAQEALSQFERERDEAKAQVDSFGYRARFQQ